MSRRESRTSLDLRQNDALFEFENFKKKFLLANKHITKLNSTLSVRVEELNAQISGLYTENLRLRASEISLANQLKHEREKSRKIMDEADSVVSSLAKHFNRIRSTFNVPLGTPKSQTPSPPSPRAVRRPTTATSDQGGPPPSPPFGRISRPPNVPGIYEEEEPCPSSADEVYRPWNDTPPQQKPKSKPHRLSASKLPLPVRAVSPSSPPTTPHVDFTRDTSTKKRKAPRRQSGFVIAHDAFRPQTQMPPSGRPDSPILGSPVKKDHALLPEEADPRHEPAKVHPFLPTVPEVVVKKEKKKIRKARDYQESEHDTEDGVFNERKVHKEKDDSKQFKLKDVTNSPRRRSALQLMENDARDVPDLPSIGRTFLASSPPRNHLPTPAPSTPAVSEAGTLPPISTTPAIAGTREKRERKSVNYAEPKLNTKMRRPDPPPDGNTTYKKRSSAAAVMTTSVFKLLDDIDRDGTDRASDAEYAGSGRSSGEYPLMRARERGDLNPASLPLPTSRPPSSSGSSTTPPSSGSSKSGGGGGSSMSDHYQTGYESPPRSETSSRHAVKRKKSKPYVIPDDDEDDFDDGAEADAEYIPPKAVGSGWVNIEGRKKYREGNGVNGRRMEIYDDRRHTIGV